MAEHKKPGRPRGTGGKKGILSDHEIDLVTKSIMNANRSTKYRNAILVLFNHYLGLKAVDLAALKVSDVFNNGLILGSLIIKEAKIPRMLMLNNPKLREVLGLYIKGRMDREGKSFDNNSALFKSQKGSFSSATLARLINTSYKDAGFSNVTSHSGKRSYVKNLVRQTQDINIISRMTGDVGMNVRRYLSDEEK